MKTRALPLLMFLLMASATASRASAPPRAVAIDRDIFVDAAGRHVILRGVNAGGRSKMPPFLPFDPEPNFDTALDAYADNVASMGFNVVRLLVIWEAAEPVRGQYDETYLQKYDAMVRAFAERDIKVVVDGHQDLYSRRFHGDGFPDWAAPPEYRDNPQTHDRKVWNRGYFSRPVLKSFQTFWANQDGLQDSHAEFHAMLARRYEDVPQVIGFEPINEPMPGWKGFLDYNGFHRDLYAYYEKVARAVHAVDPSYIIFADIAALENTGTVNTKRPRPDIHNLALAPHYYDLGTFGAAFTEGGDQGFMVLGIRRHLALARHWGVPALFTEYGVSPRLDSAPAYINELYEVFDAGLLSGTFWEASMSATLWNHENTSIFTPEGKLRPNATALDRPYPRAVAGRITRFTYDPQTGACELEWVKEENTKGPTVIYLPKRIYGNGIDVEVDPPSAWRVEGDVIVIEPASASIVRSARISPREVP